MTKSFIQELKSSIPEHLNRKQVAKFIYIYLGRHFGFDPKYSFGNSRENKLLYNSIISSPKNLNKYFETKYIICKSLSYICNYIFGYFGYKISSIGDDDNYHIFNRIEIEGIIYYLDLQLDLVNIKTGQKTKFFCSNFNNSKNYITEAEQYEIDIAINYISKTRPYTNDYIKESIDLAIANSTFLETAYSIFKNVLEKIYVNSYIEMSYFHRKVLKKCCENNNSQIVYVADCSIKNNSVKKYIIFVSFKSKKENYIFYFDTDNQKYTLILQNELEAMISNGLRIEQGDICTSKKVLNKKNLFKHTFYLKEKS